MKVLLRCLLLSVSLYACAVNNRRLTTSSRYESAYNYIINDSDIKGKSVNIADSVVYIDMSIFFEELSEECNLSRDSMLRNLDSLDNVRYFAPVKHKLEIEKTRNVSSNVILYFSKVYDNLLIAELLNGTGRYAKDRLFQTSTRYLFVFDDKSDQIKRVYKKEVQYN
ncbi:hypothetical protein [Pararcticibacter amylolyticus]|uniref:Uncharacterized protein n=1 Tax=Pararcticibacter amylolyticus TaxID=2173175 RepID=A0A2U2P9B6_9SPHI|nr:hypothetical protein [Pararcticibacter amylolyticus]PWG77977.1 hypothetical protein DDR33_24640 [Pararcticibacter amylolyticus]